MEFPSPISHDNPAAPGAGPVVSVAENPVWGFLDIFLIAAFGVVVPTVLGVITLVGAHSLSRFRGISLTDLGKMPVLIVPAQVFGYVLLVAFMIMLLKIHYGVDGFLDAVAWNAPDRRRAMMALGTGVGLGFFSAITSSLLDRWIPKSLPIQEYFRDARSAYMLAFLGIFIAPFVEELFFRGFLYPALARKLGVAAAIVLTAAPFALLHAAQLAHAWIPLLLLFVIGSVLTLARAITRSVAVPVLIHMGYNSTLFIMLFIGTQGFHHLERA